MRDNCPIVIAALLAGEIVSTERLPSRISRFRQVIEIKSDVKNHAEQEQPKHPPASTWHEQRENERSVKETRPQVLRRLSLIEELDCRQRVDLTSLVDEEEIVIDVDQDARNPRQERRPTEPRPGYDDGTA